MDDRISQLPEPILHHILSLLPQKHAIQTSILSKSWRYIGPTLPKIEIRESDFKGNNEIKFRWVVEKTLQRYVDQNLTIQELILERRWGYADLLEKWIPIVLLNMGVKTFNLTAKRFSLPSVVFQAELLEELYLEGCKLDQINNNCKKLRMLKRLSLHCVYIKNETFEKIMSSCPSIEHLVLRLCRRLSTIKVSNARNLKHFDCYSFRKNGRIEIDDAPSLETIHIKNCRNWYHNNYFLPHLKSLHLFRVHLPTEWLNNLFLKINFPCLEELGIHNCSGFFNELTLSNCLIESLKAFSLSAYDLSLPLFVFQAEFLEELNLEGCNLDQINNDCINVKLQVLKRLELHSVDIEDKTFEKIMSGCPLIQHLVLDSCEELSTIEVNKDRNLKHLDCKRINSIEINDASSLETISIRNCQNWYHHKNKNYFFPRLKSLKLWDVHLPTELLNNLSSDNCPFLEELKIRNCSGFSEFKLSNRSIKRLIIKMYNRPIKAVKIDVANILYFELVARDYLPSISFTTTLREWKSRVQVWHPPHSNKTWVQKLKKKLKAFSRF